MGSDDRGTAEMTAKIIWSRTLPHSRASGNPENSFRTSGFRVKPGMTALEVASTILIYI
jgi:hypothetical protein